MAFVVAQQEQYEVTPWQEEDLEQLEKRDWSANWSEMGCYKTTTGLWLAEKKAGEIPRVLVVTTKNGKGTYFDAIPKSLPIDWRFFDCGVRTMREIVLGTLDFKVEPEAVILGFLEKTLGGIVLAHYNCFTHNAPMKELLLKLEWDIVILDEAHRIKNRKNQWTRNLKRLTAKNRHVMTGTGFINDPSEIWQLLNWLNKSSFPAYWQFVEEYCDMNVTQAGFIKITGTKPEKKEQFRTLRRTVGVRRKMADVHAGIAHPIFTKFNVELNATQRTMYDEIKELLLTYDKKGVPISSPNVLSQLNRLRQICVATPDVVNEYYDPIAERRVQEIRLIEPSTKLDAFMEILDSLEWDEESKQKVVVFSNFRDPLSLLEARLDKEGVPYIRLLPTDNEEQRYKKWHDAWETDNYRVFLTTLQLGGESINLSAAQYAVFLDRSWSPKDNNQAVGRIYRPGQRSVPNIIHINAEHTTDQRLEATHNRKTGWFRDIFDDAPQVVETPKEKKEYSMPDIRTTTYSYPPTMSRYGR